ncbi:hypothetical protein BJV78DRAFT_380576 [Lactifluus subvellereus]|nr:hypothetical protein BJV78DRAFT_380576 [Lactifluus subvellereus]
MDDHQNGARLAWSRALWLHLAAVPGSVKKREVGTMNVQTRQHRCLEGGRGLLQKYITRTASLWCAAGFCVCSSTSSGTDRGTAELDRPLHQHALSAMRTSTLNIPIPIARTPRARLASLVCRRLNLHLYRASVRTGGCSEYVHPYVAASD